MKYDVFGFKLCVMNAAIGKIYNGPNWVTKYWPYVPKMKKTTFFVLFSIFCNEDSRWKARIELNLSF